jgi:MFS transporter, DHA1 family, multidrug resistance protein
VPQGAANSADVAAQTRALARLCTAGVLAYCSYAICRTPLLPLFARELGATPGMVGLVVGASTVTGIFVKLPAGAWSDVLGRRVLLVSGALIFATLPYGYLLVTALPLLIVVRMLHGSATAVFGPVASAALSDLAPPHRRATWLSTYAACQGFGQAAGPVLAGYLIARRGFDSAFLAAGLIALAVAFIVAGWPQTVRPGRRRSGDLMRGIREVVSHRLILLTSGAQAAQFVTHGALSAFLPLYGREALGFSVTQLGWLFGLQTVTTLLMSH